jgi:hypothetical protein
MSNEEDNQAPVTPWNLAIYYRRIFPSHIYCKWLAYGERESTIYTNIHNHYMRKQLMIYRKYEKYKLFVKELLCPNVKEHDFLEIVRRILYIINPISLLVHSYIHSANARYFV